MREMSMNGHDQSYLRSNLRSNETAARVVAYLGPYLFWVTVGVITGGIWLFQ
jgi:hypothetical protein